MLADIVENMVKYKKQTQKKEKKTNAQTDRPSFRCQRLDGPIDVKNINLQINNVKTCFSLL